MKHITIVQNGIADGLKERAQLWIEENKDNIQEIIDIDYSGYGDFYTVTITYVER